MNIFHCCAHKTGSQWIKAILSDKRVLRVSGMDSADIYSKLFKEKKIDTLDVQFQEAVPDNLIVTPLYVTYESFCTLPKPFPYKGFFVKRDPRDLLVSWYFSVHYSHKESAINSEFRTAFQNMETLQERLLNTIYRLNRGDYYRILKSWSGVSTKDENLIEIKFEELVSPSSQLDCFSKLFEHLEISMTQDELSQILEDYSFENMESRMRQASGRASVTAAPMQGVSDKWAHYRKGMPGDWINYFDESVENKFVETFGDICETLGYRDSKVDLLKNQVLILEHNLRKASKKINDLENQVSLKKESGGLENGRLENTESSKENTLSSLEIREETVNDDLVQARRVLKDCRQSKVQKIKKFKSVIRKKNKKIKQLNSNFKSIRKIQSQNQALLKKVLLELEHRKNMFSWISRKLPFWLTDKT